jgi:hypothetical protein
MEERLLSKNNFEMPAVLKDDDAAVMCIIRLITMDPGTDPLHPDMGVGIFTKFRYSFEEDIRKLKNEITNQIITYMPQLSGVSVSLEVKISRIFVTIQFNMNIVTIIVDNDNKTVTLDSLKGDK